MAGKAPKKEVVALVSSCFDEANAAVGCGDPEDFDGLRHDIEEARRIVMDLLRKTPATKLAGYRAELRFSYTEE